MSEQELRKMLSSLIHDPRAYDIMAAIRGPDAMGVAAGAAKEIFTARLRYIVAGCILPAATRPESEILLRDIEFILLDDARNLEHLTHYLNHCSSAFDKIGDVYPEYRDEARFLSRLAGILAHITFSIAAIELYRMDTLLESLDNEMRKLAKLLDEYSKYITSLSGEWY